VKSAIPFSWTRTEGGCVARLIPKTAFADRLPMEIGGITISAITLGQVTSVAPYSGREDAVSAALGALGLHFPAPGEFVVAGAARILWTGRSMALLSGAPAPEGLADNAALTDQTGALAMVELSGAGVEEALSRLIPVDLDQSAFAPGSTRRTLVGHMTASVTRLEPARFEIAVMRSMADTLLHDLERAIGTWAARP